MEKNILIKFINIKKMKQLFVITSFVFLAACSNKYESIYNSAPPPGLSFNKDTVSIREKDYSNINWTDNGRLSFFCSSPNHELNLQLSDTSGKVHIMYRGDDLINKSPLPVMDSIVVFCSCDTPGIYPVDCLLTDRLGKVSEKQLIIHCMSDKPAIPSFFYILLDNSQMQNWFYRFDASLSQKSDGIITAYHFSFNGQPVVTNKPVMDWFFHAKGTHDVGLYVTDDLGKNSDTIHKQITIQ
jgi:hypothetical protein